MKRFTQLYLELDASNRTNAKVAALKRYFANVASADGAWAVYFLTGNRIKRSVPMKDFRAWAGAACGYPDWLVDECYERVGDLAETLSLLLEQVSGTRAGIDFDPPLHRLVEERIVPLPGMDRAARRETIEAVWASLDADSCFVFNKLITGGFRVGVSKTLVHRALAELADVDPAVMAHRMSGDWRPSPRRYEALLSGESGGDALGRPYPFHLASPMEWGDPGAIAERLGATGDWQIEWKWDGIRAQLLKRGGEVMIWSRGEELFNAQFPELVDAAASWPDGTVLDGEVLAWSAGTPLAFAELQRRLGRKKVGAKLLKEAPVIFMAYDLLESEGRDRRGLGTRERRRLLEAFGAAHPRPELKLSPRLEAADWTEVARLRGEARGRAVEGLMLKHRDAAYLAGRRKGAWWKWKVDPFTADAVLVYAQQGHGRRAGIYTDYSFALWDGGELVPFAKAYSGLSDREIREVDRWIRQHTRDKRGPVRIVDPELVFEIAFEGIMPSRRHKSGIAVRFPRIHRRRRDKSADEADRMETVRALLPD